MEDIYDILDEIQSLNQRAVLATIIHVVGSAYLKEGTMMLIREDGSHVGMISAGCLEEDLKIRAKTVIGNEQSQTVCYDTKAEEDFLWGYNVGCNGMIYVLLEPLTKQLKIDFKNVLHLLEAGTTVKQVIILTSEFHQLDSFFISQNKDTFENKPAEFDQTFERNISAGLQFDTNLSTPVYIRQFLPKPRLIIFGAGYDSRPLVDFAFKAGFSVVVCDWRPSYCDKCFFPPTTQFIVCFPEEVTEKINIQKSDFVLIMTHQFQKDAQLLTALKTKNVRYLGLLGSKQRSEKLKKLTNISSQLFTPAGLPIGAQGPTEIAVSIVAEMLQVLRKERFTYE